MLRSNVPSRIALTVQKASESRIILDDAGAENLLGRGDMLVKLVGRQPVRGHGALIQPSDLVGIGKK
jgi:S-DNA-T family DNA segregation ATPase FtsK/SpoIIIE